MYDVIVRGGTVVGTDGVFRADVAVREGVIAAVGDSTDWRSHRTIDAEGLHVLPGVVDSHVHFRAPGGEHRETMVSGTSAAASGGVTTVLEMPISSPGVSSAEILTRRADLLSQTALVDFGLYAGAGAENVDELESLRDAGAVAFKTFLHPPATGRESEFFGLWCESNGEVLAVMERTAQLGLPHAVHCEDSGMIAALQARLRERGETSGLAHAKGQPVVVETVAVASMIELARATGAHLHVVHASTVETLNLVSFAREQGVDVTVEVVPNHLFLTEWELTDKDAFAKCNPPLREPAEVTQLWKAVREGRIDVVASDHAPFAPDEKAAGKGNIFGAPPGIPSVELTLPLLLTAHAQGKLALEDIVRLTSTAPADLFQLTGKGRVLPGYDGDLALVDIHEEWTFDASKSFSRSGGSMRVYEGYPLVGRVKRTLVRGKVVFDEGAIVGTPGHGRLLRPNPHSRTGR